MTKPHKITHTNKNKDIRTKTTNTPRKNVNQKTTQKIKKENNTHLTISTNTQKNNQINPPIITTNEPNKNNSKPKNQNTILTKYMSKPIRKILKRARPTGLAQNQHNKHKPKSSKEKSTHNNLTSTKIIKNENTISITHPTYAIQKNINKTNHRHIIKTPLPPSNQKHTQNLGIHHTSPYTTPKNLNKCKKHLVRLTGRTQNQGQFKHTKLNKQSTHNTPEKGRSPSLSIYISIYLIKKIKEAWPKGLIQYQHTNIKTKIEKRKFNKLTTKNINSKKQNILSKNYPTYPSNINGYNNHITRHKIKPTLPNPKHTHTHKIILHNTQYPIISLKTKKT